MRNGVLGGGEGADGHCLPRIVTHKPLSPAKPVQAFDFCQEFQNKDIIGGIGQATRPHDQSPFQSNRSTHWRWACGWPRSSCSTALKVHLRVPAVQHLHDQLQTKQVFLAGCRSQLINKRRLYVHMPLGAIFKYFEQRPGSPRPSLPLVRTALYDVSCKLAEEAVGPRCALKMTDASHRTCLFMSYDTGCRRVHSCESIAMCTCDWYSPLEGWVYFSLQSPERRGRCGLYQHGGRREQRPTRQGKKMDGGGYQLAQR